MSTEELLAALGLEMAKPAPVTDTDEMIHDNPAPVTPTSPISPTALVTDEWSRRRGKELWAEGHDFRTADEAADCWAAAFEPQPELAERYSDAQRQGFFRALLDTPDFAALHATTALNECAAELAAKSLAARIPRDNKKEDNPNPGAGAAIRSDVEMRARAALAARKAKEDLEETEDALIALGSTGSDSMGGSGGIPGGAMSAAEVIRLMESCRANPVIRKILALAGRYRMLAQTRQKGKPTHGHDEVVGIECGADLSRVVPTELVGLLDEDLELYVLRKFTERELLQREISAVTAEGKGPIVIVVDESGSMEGKKVEHAKAIALAMGWIAQYQKRWVCFVSFSGGEGCLWSAFPPGRWDNGVILTWLSHFFDGGTERDVPLLELPAAWPDINAPKGQTDVVMLTDALCVVTPDVMETWNAWRAREHVRVFTMLLGSTTGRYAEYVDQMRPISDQVFLVSELSPDAPGIDEIFSV